MKWFEVLVNGVVSGGSGTYEKLAQLLGIAGNVVKNFDANEAGFDDLAGRLLISLARMFGKIASGEASEIVVAIETVQSCLNDLLIYLKHPAQALDFRAGNVNG